LRMRWRRSVNACDSCRVEVEEGNDEVRWRKERDQSAGGTHPIRCVAEGWWRRRRPLFRSAAAGVEAGNHRRPHGAAEGATLDELIKATDWLPHTTRAALTGLRKRGYAIERTRGEDKMTRYRATPPEGSASVSKQEPAAAPAKPRLAKAA
jgi:hypothetical protein